MRRTTKLLYSYICILTMNIMGNRVMLGFSINDATVDDICVIREPHSFHLGLSAFYHVKATSLRWGGGGFSGFSKLWMVFPVSMWRFNHFS